MAAGRTVITGNIPADVSRLKQAPGQNILIAGSVSGVVVLAYVPGSSDGDEARAE